MLDLADTLGDANICGVEFLFWLALVIVFAKDTVEMASTVLVCDVLCLLALDSGVAE